MTASHVPYVVLDPVILDDLGCKRAVGIVHIGKDVLIEDVDAKIVVVPGLPNAGLLIFQQLIRVFVSAVELGIRTVAHLKPTVGHGGDRRAVRVLGKLIAGEESDELCKEAEHGLVLIVLDREHIVVGGIKHRLGLRGRYRHIGGTRRLIAVASRKRKRHRRDQQYTKEKREILFHKKSFL